MLISTKGRYALRVMVDLAEHPADGFILLKVIAERQDISEKYLESIIKLLVRAKLLTGVRGKGGGYRLTKAPEQYGRAPPPGRPVPRTRHGNDTGFPPRRPEFSAGPRPP